MAKRYCMTIVISREDLLSDWKVEGSGPDWIIDYFPGLGFNLPFKRTGRPFNIEFRQCVLKHLANCIETNPKFRLTVASAKRAGQAVQQHLHFRMHPEVRALKFSYRWSLNILQIIQDYLASGKLPGDDQPNEMFLRLRHIPKYFDPRPTQQSPPPLI